MSTRGRVLFPALACVLFLMSLGAGCPFALSETAVMPSHAPMRVLPAPGARMHSQVPASAMHALNAPARSRNNAAFGRVVQGEKRVLIHGALFRGPARSAE
jgi:hypothetical protein